MTYNPLIPAASDKPSDSQSDIQTNFSQLNTIFNLNHYNFTYGTVADRGKHKYCSFLNQAAGPVTGASESALYSKDLGGNATLYFRGQSSASEIVMSNPNAPSWSLVGTTLKAQSFLPGGLLVQFGYKDLSGGVDHNIGLVTNFANTNYMLQVSMERLSGSAQQVYVVEGSKALGSFDVHHTASGNHIVYWMAIGQT